jgi:hypothetical protein
MNDATKPHVDFFCEEGGLRYDLGRFYHDSDLAAMRAIEAVRIMACGNDRLALQLLHGAIFELNSRIATADREARIQAAMNGPVSCKWIN